MNIHGDEKEHREVSNLEVPLKIGKQTALVRSHRGPLGAHQGHDVRGCHKYFVEEYEI